MNDASSDLIEPDWDRSYPLPGGARADWRRDPKAQLAYGAFPTRSEVTLVWIASGALFAWTAWAGATLDWNWWQWAAAAFLALDIGGGAVANCLNSGKRFYHTPPAPMVVIGGVFINLPDSAARFCLISSIDNERL